MDVKLALARSDQLAFSRVMIVFAVIAACVGSGFRFQNSPGIIATAI